MSGGSNVVDPYASARLKLARLAVRKGTPLGDVCARVMWLVSQSLGVDRVGLWMFERGSTDLRCIDMYVRSKDEHFGGDVLDARTFPTYVQALESCRTVVADDARSDPDTRELRDGYLVPNGITSMLDAPVFKEGDVVGVLCHEHVGPPRHWTKDDAALAASAADIVASVFEQSARLDAETLLRAQETELARARKFEALGLFAAQIAHDFNNVLTVVQTVAEVAAERGAREEMLAVTEATAHGAQLVKQLIAFARSDEVETPAVDLAEVVAEVLSMVQGAVGDAVRVTTNLATGIARVRIDPTDVERIVMNLMLNARDAMPDGGVIDVSVAPRAASADAPEAIELAVKDSGAGMDAATQAKIFDPFFTTKRGPGVAGGSGLGLSAVYGIVRRARGTIDVTSAPGEGTTIRVRLPRAA
jgi:two-component system cell cycle sensor histidine kinase/response regulator CckA